MFFFFPLFPMAISYTTANYRFFLTQDSERDGESKWVRGLELDKYQNNTNTEIKKHEVEMKVFVIPN